MRMLFRRLLILNFILSSTQAQRLYPTEEQVKRAHDVINGVIDHNAKGKKIKEYPFIAGFVRLAFHDCVGGCDGCINHELEDNKGLLRFTSALDKVFTTDISLSMSRADFYILGGYVALERATSHKSKASEKILRSKNFKVGRVSCNTSPNSSRVPNPNFPSATSELVDLNNFFTSHFKDFTTEDQVAILGAHTLGRCSTENSGFEGKWVRGVSNKIRFKSDVFDNGYYEQLRGNWTQVDVKNGNTQKKQWQRFDTEPNVAGDDKNQPNMFLNVDMSIQWDLKTLGSIESDGKVSCKIIIDKSKCVSENNNCCKPAKTNIGKAEDNNYFKRFVQSNEEFITKFMTAFVKMTETEDTSVPGNLKMP